MINLMNLFFVIPEDVKNYRLDLSLGNQHFRNVQCGGEYIVLK